MTHSLPGKPGDLVLSFTHERSIGRDVEVAWPLWHMNAVIEGGETEPDEHVGHVSLAIVDVYENPYPFDLLDQVGADMCELAGEILDLKDGGLKADLEKQLSETGSQKVLLLHHAQLAKKWRGSGWLGALLAGIAMEELRGDCGLGFLLAKPVDAGQMSKKTFDLVKPKLRQVWSGLGFEPLSGDILFTSFIHVPFEDGLTKLKQQLGK